MKSIKYSLPKFIIEFVSASFRVDKKINDLPSYSSKIKDFAIRKEYLICL